MIEHLDDLLEGIAEMTSLPFTTRDQDPILTDLVDSLVAAVDIGRAEEVVRLRESLEPFGAATLFSDELRLNGARSIDLDQCLCEVWL